MRVRIFEITTEEEGARPGSAWGSYRVAAPTAAKAVAKAEKSFSKEIGEQLLGVKLLASED